MKLGVVGKGGAGKTAVAALLARAYAQEGRRVLAVDTDSNPNLALNLGLDPAAADQVPVLPRSLVVGSDGSLSPSQLVAEYGADTPAGVTLLHATSITDAGSGCLCASHTSVRSLLGAALEEQADATVVDMEAGLEHLTRSGGTLAYADVLLAVMDPTWKAAQAVVRTRDLAEELGIPRLYAVGTKARSDEDRRFFSSVTAEHGLELATVLPYDPAVIKADRDGTMVTDYADATRDAVAELVAVLDSPDDRKAALHWQLDQVERRLSELQPGSRGT